MHKLVMFLTHVFNSFWRSNTETSPGLHLAQGTGMLLNLLEG